MQSQVTQDQRKVDHLPIKILGFANVETFNFPLVRVTVATDLWTISSDKFIKSSNNDPLVSCGQS